MLLLEDDQAMVDADGRLALLSPDQVENLIGDVVGADRLLLYLGRVYEAEGIPGDGISVVGDLEDNLLPKKEPVLALMLTPAEKLLFEMGDWSSLRKVARELNPLDAGILTRAVALANWHKANQFSPRTGDKTSQAKGGWVRVEKDGSEHFPRTDPAIIVAVTDAADRILLASNAAWNEKVFSLIAGFVDPGESLEQAVIREVYEESRIKVSNPKYLGSQPWPFPASLMLGFSAFAHETENLQPDGVEIRALRWFSREELQDAVVAGEVIVPRGSSISRVIIDSWHGGDLGGF